MAGREKDEPVHQVVLERRADDDQGARVVAGVAQSEYRAQVVRELRRPLRVVHVLHVHRGAVVAQTVERLKARDQLLGVCGQRAVVVLLRHRIGW